MLPPCWSLYTPTVCIGISLNDHLNKWACSGLISECQSTKSVGKWEHSKRKWPVSPPACGERWRQKDHKKMGLKGGGRKERWKNGACSNKGWRFPRAVTFDRGMLTSFWRPRPWFGHGTSRWWVNWIIFNHLRSSFYLFSMRASVWNGTPLWKCNNTSN